MPENQVNGSLFYVASSLLSKTGEGALQSQYPIRVVVES